MDKKKLKIAVIGGGISGLSSAYLLSKKHDVDLYEKELRLGGHARTTMVQEDTKKFGVDTGFLVFNHPTYPLLTKLFQELNIEIENSNMSFGFWDTCKNIVYSGHSLKGMFVQKRNFFNINHYKMIFDILRFNKQANYDLETQSKRLDLTLKNYLEDYSDVFKERYLIPMGAAIWSTPSSQMDYFPARTFITFFKNHGLLGVDTHHQWLTVKNGSINYVQKIAQKISGTIYLDSEIHDIKREDSIVSITNKDTIIAYDKIIFATHAPDTIALLGDGITQREKEILSKFVYKKNKAVLHNDTELLYPDKKTYCAWNYKSNNDDTSVTLSYWINNLQNLHTKKEYFVSLNEVDTIRNPIEEIEYEHPQFTKEALEMQGKREEINGQNNTYFAGAYWRYGFHEDGLYSANTIAEKYGCEL